MISLISTWPLKKGCPDSLVKSLFSLADEVALEEGTLQYLVYLQAPFPLDSNSQPLAPPPASIALPDQKTITFFEIYRDSAALSDHIRGTAFINFKASNGEHFIDDAPMQSSQRPNTVILQQLCGFSRRAE